MPIKMDITVHIQRTVQHNLTDLKSALIIDLTSDSLTDLPTLYE